MALMAQIASTVRQTDSASDRRHLRRALTLAARGVATTSPNPHVGALVVQRGRVVGEGWHRRAGEAHAEPQALAAAGSRARGATLYVNLEPCAHHGRTPPCVEAILSAGVKRVVIAHRDPDPRTAGRGVESLRAAGVRVEVGVEAERALRLNSWFVVERWEKRPAVTLKWGASLDGKTASSRGESRWITGPQARRDALRLREEHDAILVGVGTVLADDPRLDRRLGSANAPNVRVILDRSLRTPPEAAMFSCPGPVWIFTERPAAGSARRGRRGRPALEARGATIIELVKVTPRAVVRALHARAVQSVLVEGGGTVADAFVRAGLCDRVVAYLAPCLIGGASASSGVAGTGIGRLAARFELEPPQVRRCGADVRLESLRAGFLADALARLAGAESR